MSNFNISLKIAKLSHIDIIYLYFIVSYITWLNISRVNSSLAESTETNRWPFLVEDLFLLNSQEVIHPLDQT